MYLFWIVTVISCIIPNQYVEYCYNLMTLSFMIMIINELKREKLLIGVALIYWYAMDMLFQRNIEAVVTETMILFALAVLLRFMPEINNLPYNDKNICIAFYRGKNGSIKARLSALLGLDVTSVEILYKGSLWRYKSGKLIEMKDFKASDEFVFYDTGIKATAKHGKLLRKIQKENYKKSFFKANCTRILSQFLVELQLQPTGLFQSIPSLYLRGLLNGR